MLSEIKRGQEIIYYRGYTPCSLSTPKDFITAYDLYREGKVNLFQRLVSRTDGNYPKGLFEYIAVGK